MTPTTRNNTLIALALFLGILLIAPAWAGGPITRDELYYLNAAMDPFPSFRGFHIYFLKIFLLFSEPLAAAKRYWAFVTALTTALTYLNATLLAPHKTWITGLLAVLLLFATTSIFRLTGVPYSDFTVMLMVTLGITLYLLYQHMPRHRWFPLIAFGLTLFFTMESKPTGLILATLLPGLGVIDQHPFRWQRLLANMALILLGIAIGQTTFMLLNTLFQQPDILAGTEQYAVVASVKTINRPATGQYPRDLTWTWYTTLLQRKTLLLIIILYSLSIIGAVRNSLPPASRLLWMLPLAALMFLSLATIQVEFGGERHILLILPALAMLAAQFYPLETSPTHTSNKNLLLALLLALLLVTAYFQVLPVLSRSDRWTTADLHTLLDLPLAIALLATILIWRPRWQWITLTGWLTAILVAISFSLLNIPSLMAETASRSTRYFYPYEKFADSITYREDMRVFISQDIPEEQHMLSQYLERSNWMFSIYFNQLAQQNQFTISDTPLALLRSSYDYAFLTRRDLMLLQRYTAQNITPFTSRYLISYDMDHDLVFAVHVETLAANARAMLAQQPTSPRAMLHIAQAALHQGEYEAAIDELNQLITLAPANSHAYLVRGRAWHALGEDERALTDFNQALTLSPGDSEVLLERGCTAAAAGKQQQAKDDFAQLLQPSQLFTAHTLPRNATDCILRSFPTLAAAHASRGQANLMLHAWEAAISDYSQAIVHAPDWYVGYGGRGHAYRRMHQWELAIADFTAAIERNPEEPQLYLERGLAYAALEQRGNAVSDMLQVLKRSNDPALQAQARQHLQQLKPWERLIQK
jgi:tetratricopeptide (TPR) repeat protein